MNRRARRSLSGVLAATAAAGIVACVPTTPPATTTTTTSSTTTSTSTTTTTAPPAPVAPTFLGRYTTGLGNTSGETVAFGDGKLFVTNTASGGSVDVVSLADPTAPTLITRIPTAPGLPNSVAVSGGLVAVAVEDAVKTNPGKVLFFDTDGNPLGDATVGALPDMVTFTADGNRVLVANEGEPNSYNQPTSVDPEGSVSVVDVSAIRSVGAAPVATIGFGDFNVGGPRAAELPAGVRVFGPNATVAQDLEPEYLAVHPDGTRAWVTLQEANAIAEVDLIDLTVTSIRDLGRRDESLAVNGFDASDRDGAGTAPLAGNIANWPVASMYQPDAIALFVRGGQPYLVSANEGDSRDYTGFNEESRVGAAGYVLDPSVFTDPTLKTSDDKLSRLTVTTASGNTDTDAEFERIDLFGSRSFSIWNADSIAQVYDSGRELEQRTFAAFPANFNASNDGNAVDNRSDNKGPEPEGATVVDVDGRPVAFIGLERIGGVVAYDVSDPSAPQFDAYVNQRDFSQAAAPDSGPEVLASVPAGQNATGRPLLLVANEITGTVLVYRL